jgi:hypothetical protein
MADGCLIPIDMGRRDKRGESMYSDAHLSGRTRELGLTEPLKSQMLSGDFYLGFFPVI